MANCALFNSGETITATLTRLSGTGQQENLLNTVSGLYEVASAFTQGGSGVTLCSLREGAANRYACLRKAAAGGKASEKATEEATQRLALYYKSGIKPSELASLLFSLAGGIAAPISAAK